MIYFALGYYLIGVIVLWILFLLAKHRHPNPYVRQLWQPDWGKILIGALVWPLIIIGAILV